MIHKDQDSIDCERRKCAICRFPLNLEIQNAQEQGDKITYFNLLTRKENTFLRNLFKKDKLLSYK